MVPSKFSSLQKGKTMSKKARKKPEKDGKGNDNDASSTVMIPDKQDALNNEYELIAKLLESNLIILIK